jgi:hypothetical protein
MFSRSGPPGILIAGGKGALRCLMLNTDSNFEAIPVDSAISGLIMIAKYLGTLPQRYREIFSLKNWFSLERIFFGNIQIFKIA